MFYYAFTFQKNTNPAFPCHYIEQIQCLEGKYPTADIAYVYEVGGKQNKLHIHGLCKSPKKMYINRIHPGEGWSVDWSLIRSPSAWHMYMHKTNPDVQDRILNEYLQLEHEFYHPLDEESEELIDIVPFYSDDPDDHELNARLTRVRIV